jgi:trypsin
LRPQDLASFCRYLGKPGKVCQLQLKLFTVLATWAALAAVAVSPSTAVVGGTDAAPGEFPSVAEITFGAFVCTGTLIDSTHVLSAGHCGSATGAAVASPVGWPTPLIDVRIGSNKSGEGEQVPVSQVTVSPDYLGLTNRNDLSILTLEHASTHAPTQVAAGSERSIWNPGVLATIVGWGVTDPDDDEAPNTLQKANVPITTDAYCESAYPDDEGWDFDPETMVCAGYPEGGVDSCYGDSGGPLFAQTSTGARRVVGVTSWGNGCAEKNSPGVYARVADTKLRTWVASEVPAGVARDSTPADSGTGTDGDGAPSDEPAEADTTPPETTLRRAKPRLIRAATTRRKAIYRFRFRSSEADSTFECKLDRRDWRRCGSPRRVKVAQGRHKFRVRATDSAGNTDRTPAISRWRVRKPS